MHKCACTRKKEARSRAAATHSLGSQALPLLRIYPLLIQVLCEYQRIGFQMFNVVFSRCLSVLAGRPRVGPQPWLSVRDLYGDTPAIPSSACAYLCSTCTRALHVLSQRSMRGPSKAMYLYPPLPQLANTTPGPAR
ncbi:hypothetical protein HDV62DRAFT_346715 [Trichoderma sp. SZMC 28011]